MFWQNNWWNLVREDEKKVLNLMDEVRKWTIVWTKGTEFNASAVYRIKFAHSLVVLCFAVVLYHQHLTHWGRDKMAVILQTSSNVFSWMKMCKLRLRFHWGLLSRVQITIYCCFGLDNGLAPTRWQAIIWTNGGIVYSCIFESLSLNELTLKSWAPRIFEWNI